MALSASVPMHAKAPKTSLAELHAADQKIGIIGARLADSGSDFCREQVGSIGLILDDAMRYAPDMQGAAAALIGNATAPTVIAIMPGGSAERAGVRVGDAIVGVDGWMVPDVADRPRSEAVLDRLEAVLPPQSFVLHIRRAGKAISLAMVSKAACRSRFQVRPGGRLQGQANGDRVEIASGAIRMTRNDDELAVVLAHELAHNILDHRNRLAMMGAFDKGVSRKRALVLNQAMELEADRLAVYLADRAGFDPRAFGTLWRRLGRGGGSSHAPNAARIAITDAEMKRINDTRESGRLPRPEGLDPYLRPLPGSVPVHDGER